MRYNIYVAMVQRLCCQVIKKEQPESSNIFFDAENLERDNLTLLLQGQSL
jgi:hypothetical protein